jgi:hypothetical protein
VPACVCLPSPVASPHPTNREGRGLPNRYRLLPRGNNDDGKRVAPTCMHASASPTKRLTGPERVLAIAAGGGHAPAGGPIVRRAYTRQRAAPFERRDCFHVATTTTGRAPPPTCMLPTTASCTHQSKISVSSNVTGMVPPQPKRDSNLRYRCGAPRPLARALGAHGIITYDPAPPAPRSQVTELLRELMKEAARTCERRRTTPIPPETRALQPHSEDRLSRHDCRRQQRQIARCSNADP